MQKSVALCHPRAGSMHIREVSSHVSVSAGLSKVSAWLLHAWKFTFFKCWNQKNVLACARFIGRGFYPRVNYFDFRLRFAAAIFDRWDFGTRTLTRTSQKESLMIQRLGRTIGWLIILLCVLYRMQTCECSGHLLVTLSLLSTPVH